MTTSTVTDRAGGTVSSAAPTMTDRRTGIMAGIACKAPVLAATTANITLSGTQTIDGVALVAADRVLVKNQTTDSQNGVYDVSSGAWTRSTDFDSVDEITKGTVVPVAPGGTTNGATFWMVSSADPTTIDSSSITLTQFHPTQLPLTSTDNTVARFSGTDGTLQGSIVVIDDSGNICPETTDTGALGTSLLMWSDLFLASGAVINFNNGDVTVTHAANSLAFAGASSGYSFDAEVFPAANDGAALGDATHNFSDLFLASGAVVNWNNGDVTLTHSANALAFAGASSGYSFDAEVLPAANDGAALGDTTHNFSDLFLASGAVINFNAGDVTITHAADALAFAGAASGYSFDHNVVITTAVANGLAVGANGTTNPVLKVDASAASVATGIAITGAAAAGRAAVSVLSSGVDEGLGIDAKGAGTVRLGATSTGAIEFSRNAVPTASDGAALGTTALMWSDLFLASGAVVNFNNGDVTLTHAANALAFAGASSGYSFDAEVLPASNDGAALGDTTHNFSDLFLASGAVINFNNGDVTVTHSANTLAFAGASSGYTFDALVTITSASASALTVGANGSTNPVLKIDASTVSVATGISIAGAAAAARAAIAVISSGVNEGLSVDAKGSGTIRLGATSTGAVEFSRNAVPTASDGAALGTTALMWSDLFLASGAVINFNNGDVTVTHSANTLAFAGAASGYTFDALATITSASASALTVGANGSTNPVLKIDASTVSVATGISITGAAAAGRAAVAVISSGVNEGLSIDAKGSGTIRLGATSTGAVEFSRNAVPTASDGAALGTSSLMWSDLFLASGAVVNFNNGNITLTHAAGTLTMAGGTLILPSAGLEVGSSVPFSDSAGTLTLQNVDAVDSTTSTTLGPHCFIRLYTANDTWTKPSTSRFKRVKVWVVGGGGGGGGSGTANNRIGGGGGGGGMSYMQILAASLSASETVTVGAAGTGGAAGANNGTAGGASSFGAHCSANGGGLGIAGDTDGQIAEGGTATGGDFNNEGSEGTQSSTSFSTAAYSGAGGTAGGAPRTYIHFYDMAVANNTAIPRSSFIGWLSGGGAEQPPQWEVADEAGRPGYPYGGGGSGGTRAVSTNKAGGDGYQGAILVMEEYE